MGNKRFNLAALDTKARADQGFEHQITSHANELTGVFITVIGRDAEEYQRALRRYEKRAVEKLARNRKFVADPEQADRDRLDLLVLATVAWCTVDEDGKKELVVHLGEEALVFTPANARKLYTQIPMLREQMQEVVDDRENFLPSSATSS